MCMCCWKKIMTGWRNAWSMKQRVQDQEEDQRGPRQRLSKRTVNHVNWTRRMLWVVVNGGSWYRMSDDQDGCEWVHVSSGTGPLGWSGLPDQRASNGCVCVCVCVSFPIPGLYERNTTLAYAQKCTKHRSTAMHGRTKPLPEPQVAFGCVGVRFQRICVQTVRQTCSSSRYSSPVRNGVIRRLP